MNVSDLSSTKTSTASTLSNPNEKKEGFNSFENYLYDAADAPKEENQEASPQEITEQLLKQLFDFLQKNIMPKELQDLMKKLEKFMEKMQKQEVSESELREFLKSFNKLYAIALEGLGNRGTTLSKEETKKENKASQESLPMDDLRKQQENIQETIRELEGKNNFESSIKKQSLKTEELVLANDIRGMIRLSYGGVD